MQRIYLDHACTSPPPPDVWLCSERYRSIVMNEALSASDVTRALKALLPQARAAAASLIGAQAQSIALVNSTSHALGVLSQIIPLSPGDTLLVYEGDYPALVLAFSRRGRGSVSVRPVRAGGAGPNAADYAACMDASVKGIVLSSVQETNGYRADIASIARLAHDHEAYCIVDGSQEAGSLFVNIGSTGADFYMSTGKKWIGNPFGMGFLYAAPHLLSTIPPAYAAFSSVTLPQGYTDSIAYLEDVGRSAFDHFSPIAEARKFEPGGYANYLGAMGLSAAAGYLGQRGMHEIEKHNLALHACLRESLAHRNLCWSSPEEEDRRSAIAAFHFGFCENGRMEKALVRYLQERGIFLSLRAASGQGGIRVSMHHSNTPDDIRALARAVDEFMHDAGLA